MIGEITGTSGVTTVGFDMVHVVDVGVSIVGRVPVVMVLPVYTIVPVLSVGVGIVVLLL
jgi:hypothetical protein